MFAIGQLQVTHVSSFEPALGHQLAHYINGIVNGVDHPIIIAVFCFIQFSTLKKEFLTRPTKQIQLMLFAIS